jgi:hypothetical protein
MKSIEDILFENGYRVYRHRSGFVGWFKTNPMEYSDEWEQA